MNNPILSLDVGASPTSPDTFHSNTRPNDYQQPTGASAGQPTNTTAVDTVSQIAPPSFYHQYSGLINIFLVFSVVLISLIVLYIRKTRKSLLTATDQSISKPYGWGHAFLHSLVISIVVVVVLLYLEFHGKDPELAGIGLLILDIIAFIFLLPVCMVILKLVKYK